MFSVLKKLLVTSLVASGGASGVVVEVARDNLVSGSVTPSDAVLSSAEGTEEKEDSSSFEEVSTQEPTTMQQESDDSALVVRGEDPNVGTNSEDEKEKNDVPAKELTNSKEAGEKVVKQEPSQLEDVKKSENPQTVESPLNDESILKEIKVPTPSSPSPIKVKEMPLGDLPPTSINEEKLQTSVLEIEEKEEEEWHRLAQGYFLVSSNDFGMLEQMEFDSKNVKCMNKVIK